MTVPRYLPAAWSDETVPTALESSDAYIERDGDRWLLRLPKDDPDRENEFYVTPVVPGQIVEFLANEDYGHFELSIGEDRRFTTDRPYPAKANGFWIPFDPDTMQHSLRELVEGGEHDGEPLGAGEHVIGIYWWSGPIPMRFEIDGDGEPHFVASAGAN